MSQKIIPAYWCDWSTGLVLFYVYEICTDWARIASTLLDSLHDVKCYLKCQVPKLALHCIVHVCVLNYGHPIFLVLYMDYHTLLNRSCNEFHEITLIKHTPAVTQVMSKTLHHFLPYPTAIVNPKRQGYCMHWEKKGAKIAPPWGAFCLSVTQTPMWSYF